MTRAKTIINTKIDAYTSAPNDAVACLYASSAAV